MASFVVFPHLALDAPSIYFFRGLPTVPRSQAIDHMSPLYKILLIIAHTTSIALIMTPQVPPSFALAKPIARSSQSRNMAVHHVKERSVRVLKSKNSKLKAVVPHNSHPNPANVSYHPKAYSSPGSHVTAGAYGRSGDININTIVEDVDVLNGYYTKTYNNAQTLSTHSISLLNDALRSSRSCRVVFLSSISFKTEGQIQISTELRLCAHGLPH